jgi:hypothetical protein
MRVGCAYYPCPRDRPRPVLFPTALALALQRVRFPLERQLSPFDSEGEGYGSDSLPGFSGTLPDPELRILCLQGAGTYVVRVINWSGFFLSA